MIQSNYPELFDKIMFYIEDGGKINPKFIKDVKWKLKLKQASAQSPVRVRERSEDMTTKSKKNSKISSV